MYWESTNGNVGIGTGTASPSAKLHVNSGSANEVARFQSTDGTAYLSIMDSNTTYSLQGIGSVGDKLVFYSNNSEKMRIDDLGNVGIGTTSPANNLHIRGSANGDGLTIQRNSSTSGAFADLMFSVTSSDAAAPNAKIRATRGSSYEDTDISIITNSTERMRIDSSGNVGIGTNSPSAKLTVEETGTSQESVFRLIGTNTADSASQVSEIVSYQKSGGLNQETSLDFRVRKNADSYASPTTVMTLTNGNVGIGTSSPNAKLDIQNVPSGGSGTILNIGLDASNPVRAKIHTESYSGAFSLYNSGSIENVKITTSGNSYFNGGNVGIGTNSPSEKLEVDGNVKADAMVLTSPNGTKYEITVANDGTLTSTAI